MAGPAFGPGLVQGAATGFQGQNLAVEQLIRQLQARAAEGQLQDQQAQRAGTGGAYDAISQLFGGADAQPGGQPMPTSPAPGQPSVPLQQAGQPMPQQAPTINPSDAPGASAGDMAPQGAPGMSPARAVLQGVPVPPQPPAQQPNAQPTNLQSLVKVIDARMPGASPQAKMAALTQLSGMLDASSQRQFQQMKTHFDMQLEVAKLNQRAEHYLQQSMDRRLSIEERATAAREHQQTLIAIGQIAAGSREKVQTMKSDQQTLSRDLRAELGNRKLGQEDTKIENLKAYRDERLRLEQSGLDEKEARRIAYERVQAAHDQTRRDVVGTQQEGAMARTKLRTDAHSAEHAAALDLRDRLGGMRLTPEQTLMSNQLRSLTSRYGAIAAASGPNSPAAKALNGQIQTLTKQIEGTVTQGAPARAPTPVPGQPIQPNAGTRPPVPAGLAGKDIQAGQDPDGKWLFRDKATGTTYDAQGAPLRGEGGGGVDLQDRGGDGPGTGTPEGAEAPVQTTPSGGKVQIKGRGAPSIVDAVWGRGAPPEDDSALARLMRARRGAGARDAR